MCALARNLSASSPEVFIDIGNFEVEIGGQVGVGAQVVVGAQVEVGAQPLG